uniref:Uncharacterized protein n=1 Tax=viral metagenome TaxID=1070528 RepID=A0A6C0J756_9ZZZZ
MFVQYILQCYFKCLLKLFVLYILSLPLYLYIYKITKIEFLIDLIKLKDDKLKDDKLKDDKLKDVS